MKNKKNELVKTENIYNYYKRLHLALEKIYIIVYFKWKKMKQN